MSELQKTIIIGRHNSGPLFGDKTPEDLGMEIVAHKSIDFSTDLKVCNQQLLGLLIEAKNLNAQIIFQAVPGILIVSICKIRCEWEYYNGQSGNDGYFSGYGDKFIPFQGGKDKYTYPLLPKIGVIISVPGKRNLDTEHLESKTEMFSSAEDAGKAKDLIEFANPRAKTTYGFPNLQNTELTVELVPLGNFVFSHIEWF